MPQTHSELRVGAVAVLSVVLGDLAHIAASGDVLNLDAHLVSLMLLTVALYPLGRKWCGTLPTLANLALGQAVVHVVASLFSHQHEPAASHALATAQSHGGAPSPLMLLGHLVAVGLCALWLSRGEQVMGDALSILSSRLFGFPLVPEAGVPSSRTALRPFAPLVAMVLPTGVGTIWAHRGPPSI